MDVGTIRITQVWRRSSIVFVIIWRRKQKVSK